ncbi:ribosomal protein L6 (BL8) [Candidatus Hydrogenisulfobacillus filiaventi]|uniref:Large ribosomal subunit protein uL6 n=1 Tax=Candidatus Hydrogenisulfobacillus filiaventi TaxID=2707344 RepID=A0A6F8ZKE8_9FIRM|nr:50S ribosomal protein L6 [Bacillota bacterium]CAB1129933.1 ribosomal protein L6 (BL8) [Candidatus Hydrogenisulfobacillus filiaventi]
MSRIGKRPIAVPAGVEVDIDGLTVRVQGPKGRLERTLRPEVRLVREENTLRVEPVNESRMARQQWGLWRTLVANMVEGVSTGYQKQLELTGVGYRASKQGRTLTLTVGFSHPVNIDPPEGIEFEVPNATNIIVRGYDKEKVGQVAAQIRSVRPPEPYKGKGIHYLGERIRRKVGKTGKR